MNQVTETTMTEAQIVAMVACMLSVAHVDGLRPEETALIRKFYEDSWIEGMPAFDTLPLDGGNAFTLLGALPRSQEFADQLVMMAAMTGFCDGNFSAAERVHVDRLALAVGTGAERVEELVQEVKDSLIKSLAHLPDSGGVAALAKSL